MLKVFPCYPPQDRPLVRELAGFLERGAGVEVLLEEGEIQPGCDLVGKVEEGLSADVVLALVSPEAGPAKWILERWKPVFWDQAASVGTPVATLLCRDSKFPELLRRKNFFDLRLDRMAGFRAIKRWLMSLSPLPEKAPFAPAASKSFRGREGEMEKLRSLLADAPGVAVIEGGPGAGKTVLALEFAYRHQLDFDAVLWLTCGSRTTAALAGDLAAQMGVRLDQSLESCLHALRRLCAQHRCLIVLDDAAAEASAQLAPRGRTSVLLTTRQSGLAGTLSATALSLDPWAGGGAATERAIGDLSRPAQRLLLAMCACSPSGFPLDMALRTADIEPDEAAALTAALTESNLVLPLDANGPRLLVPSAVREGMASLGDNRRWARYHARTAADLFGSQTGEPSLTAYWPELQHAFATTLPADWLAASTLARRALVWAKAQDRLAEAFEVLDNWHAAAERKGDRRVLEDCAWEQIWILEHWGNDGEARELDTLRRQRYADQMAFSFDQS